MQIEVVKSKIHRVTVTGADLNYIGSITIDEDLMFAANIIEGEKVQIVNIVNYFAKNKDIELYVYTKKSNSLIFGDDFKNGITFFCASGSPPVTVT